MSHKYSFEIVNPSSPPVETIANGLGIEMTEPSIARICGLGNIDPQHGPSSTSTSPATIEACLDAPMPPTGARLLTIRPDMDALGGMAVFVLRSEGVKFTDEMMARIKQVAEADRFSRGAWPGCRCFSATVDDILKDGDGPELTALGICGFDRKTDMARKVEIIADWLKTGQIPEIWINRALKPAQKLLASMNNGSTSFSLHADEAIAMVQSTQPGALRQAYRLAPVVIACNPAFRFSDIRGVKYTIARWSDMDADFAPVAKHLADLEQGWGGQAGIMGSPQASPSKLKPEQVIECLKHGLPKQPVFSSEPE